MYSQRIPHHFAISLMHCHCLFFKKKEKYIMASFANPVLCEIFLNNKPVLPLLGGRRGSLFNSLFRLPLYTTHILFVLPCSIQNQDQPRWVFLFTLQNIITNFAFHWSCSGLWEWVVMTEWYWFDMASDPPPPHPLTPFSFLDLVLSRSAPLWATVEVQAGVQSPPCWGPQGP